MKIFKVCYDPDISFKAKKIIRDRVSYSMISNDESTCQYEIDMCIETLDLKEDLEDDLKYLKKLDVQFIEF